jgi:hypothetical protein
VSLVSVRSVALEGRERERWRMAVVAWDSLDLSLRAHWGVAVLVQVSVCASRGVCVGFSSLMV